jgi:WD40 repeat protein
MTRTLNLARNARLFAAATRALALGVALCLSHATLAQPPTGGSRQRERGLGLPAQRPTPPAQTAARAGSAVRPQLVLQTGYAFYGAERLVFSPDGRLLATTTFFSDQIKLWDVATGRELRTLSNGGAGQSTNVTALAFSPDSRRLAAGGRDNKTVVWDVATARAVSTLAPPPPQGGPFADVGALLAPLGVLAVVFSGDGARLTTFGGAIRTWDVQTGRLLYVANDDNGASVTFAPGGVNPDSGFALNADGTQLAVLSFRGLKKTPLKLVVYEAASGRVLRTVPMPEGFPALGETSLAFTPDGGLRAAVIALNGGPRDGARLELWNLDENGVGRVLTRLARTFGGVACFSRDGRWLALSAGQTIRVWDTATGAERQTFNVDRPAWRFELPDPVQALAFSADGRFLSAALFNGPVNVWEVETGRATQQLTARVNISYNVAFSPDGTRLLSGGKTVWDLTTGVGLRAANAVEPYAVPGPDGKLVAAVTLADERVTLYDAPRQRRLFTLTPAASVATTPTAAGPFAGKVIAQLPVFSPDGRILATTYSLDNKPGQAAQPTRADTTDATDADQPAPVAPPRPRNNQTARASVESASLPKQVKLWDTATGRELRTLNVKGSSDARLSQQILRVAFSPDGRQLAVTMFSDPVVTFWDVQTGAQLRSLGAQDDASAPASLGGQASALGFSADGRVLAIGGTQPLAPPGTKPGFDATAMMTQLGGLLRDPKAAGTLDIKTLLESMMLQAVPTTGVLKLYNAATGRELRALGGHKSEVKAVALSPDARLLASAAADNLIKLWDAQTGRELFTLAGHTAQVNSLAFNSDGRLLASASDDGSTVLWDARTGAQLATLASLYDGDDWLVVTPNGFFDGSPVAWDQVLWRYNEDTFNVAPVESFFGEFFDEGLLRKIVAGTLPAAAADFADRDRRQPTLTLTLAEPGAQAAAPLAMRAVKVRVEVRDAARDATHNASSGARDLRLFRNGSLVRAWRGDVLKGQASIVLETTLPLVAGENRLTANVFNRDNVKSRDATLRLTGADALKRAGTAHVLAIGVNEYANTQYNLRYAVADAEDFSAEVERQQAKLGRFDKVSVTTLLNREATKANILSALAKLASTTQPEDAVVVYFAGHGLAQPQKRFFLVPHDLGYTGSRTQFDPAGLPVILQHSISNQELETAFERVNAGQIMLVIDACDSGQALEADERRRAPLNAEGLAQLAYDKGMYILTAAQGYQAALEVAELGHGLLTYTLIEEGLRQAAADAEPQDGAVLAREWFNYAVRRLPDIRLDKFKKLRQSAFAAELAQGAEAARTGQTPRVFYRRELEAQPLVVARTGGR